MARVAAAVPRQAGGRGPASSGARGHAGASRPRAGRGVGLGSQGVPSEPVHPCTACPCGAPRPQPAAVPHSPAHPVPAAAPPPGHARARTHLQDSANPAVIPRNHVMVDIIGEAETGNYEPLHRWARHAAATPNKLVGRRAGHMCRAACSAAPWPWFRRACRCCCAAQAVQIRVESGRHGSAGNGRHTDKGNRSIPGLQVMYHCPPWCRYMRALLNPYSSEGLDPSWLEPAPKQVRGGKAVDACPPAWLNVSATGAQPGSAPFPRVCSAASAWSCCPAAVEAAAHWQDLRPCGLGSLAAPRHNSCTFVSRFWSAVSCHPVFSVTLVACRIRCKTRDG